MGHPLTFREVVTRIRSKSFGVLSTVSPKGYSQSTGVLFGLSKSDPFSLFIFSDRNYKKVKNIQKNPHVSFLIPFPHHWFRFVPANTVTFQASAELLPFDDPAAYEVFKSQRILRMMLEGIEKSNVFIRLQLDNRLHVYGLGYSIFELRESHVEGSYYVETG